MSIQKHDVVHLICGLSSAAKDLVSVTNSHETTTVILEAIEKL